MTETADTETTATSRPSAAAKILDAVALVTEDYLFDGSDTYIVVKNGTGGVRTINVGKAEFARWASRAVRESDRSLVTSEGVKTARLAIESHAEALGRRPAPTIRVAERADGAILIDLGDEKWRCIEVMPTGWRVIPHPADGPYFDRPQLMAALPVPLQRAERGPDALQAIWKYINVAPETRFLKLVGLLHKWLPQGPYAIEAFNGPQGSTKTSSQKADKALTDPTRPGPKEKAPTSLRRPAREERTLKSAARNAHTLSFDNVSRIDPAMADAHCAISTGADFGGFKLYTDSDEDVLNACRPQTFNGIPDIIRQGDLADRTVIYPMVPPEKRLSETELWTEFVREWPAMLGALLDVLSSALAFRDQAALPEGVDVRMMDFALFGEAVGLAVKKEPGTFTRAFHANRVSHALDIAEGDLLWGPLNAMLDAQPGATFTGTMDEIRKAVSIHAGASGSDKFWPKSGQAMSAYVRRMKPAWTAAGITVDQVETRSNRGQEYTITRTTPPNE